MEYIQQHMTNVTMACEFRGSSTTPTWRQQTLSPYTLLIVRCANHASAPKLYVCASVAVAASQQRV